MQTHLSTPKWFLPAIALVGLLLALLFTLPGFYSHYIADDYCFSAATRTYPFFQAQSYFYNNISNRYSVLPWINLTELLGERSISYVPFLSVTLWLAAGTWLFAGAARRARMPQPFWLGMLASNLIVFFTILMAPNRFQSVYWRSGNLTYLMPLAWMTLLGGWLFGATSQPHKTRHIGFLCAATLLISFFTAGYSETSTAVMVVALAMALAGVLMARNLENRKTWLWFLGAAFLGALIGLLLLFISPGNFRRTSVLPDPPGFFTFLRLSFLYAFDFIKDSLKTLPLPTAVMAAVFGLIGLSVPTHPARRKGWLWLVAIPLVTYGLLVAAASPSVYAESAYPEQRAWFVGRWVLNIGLSSVAFWAGMLLSSDKRWPKRTRAVVVPLIFTLILIFGYGGRSTFQVLQQLPANRSRAVAWDARHAQIALAEPDATITIPALDSWYGLEEMGPDPQGWVNRCAAQFYGLTGIIAVEEP